MKTLNLAQMESVTAGMSWCDGLMYGWGLVATAGAAMSLPSAGASVAVAAVWGGLTYAICDPVNDAIARRKYEA